MKSHAPSIGRLQLFACVVLAGLLPASPVAGQSTPPVIPLWEKGAPGFENRKDEPEQADKGSVTNVHYPTLTAFLPSREKANGVAIVVAPGGGLSKLGFQSGGVEPAELLAKEGYTAFVLKYRLPRQPGVPYKFEEHTLQDGQRAIRMVRSKAAELGFHADKVGILGFSAGGEVVSLISYRSGNGNASAEDPVDRLNGRPDFQLLVYPGPLGIPSALPPNSPPAFLLIAADDPHTSVLLNLMQRFRETGTPYECHIYTRGGHGFGMGKRTQRLSLSHWPDRMLEWLHDEVLHPGTK
jgi:acetyl esterase/lipase